MINIYTTIIISTLDWLKNNKKNNKNQHYCWDLINYSKKFCGPVLELFFKDKKHLPR